MTYLFSEIKHYRESLLDLCTLGWRTGGGGWGASDLGRGEVTRWRTPPTLMSARRLPQQAPRASCTRVPQPLLPCPSPRGGRLRCAETRLTAETGSNEETHTPPSPRAGERRGTVTGRGWKGRLQLSLPAWPHSSSPSPPEQGSPAPIVGRVHGTLTEGHSPPHVPGLPAVVPTKDVYHRCAPRLRTADFLSSKRRDKHSIHAAVMQRRPEAGGTALWRRAPRLAGGAEVRLAAGVARRPAAGRSGSGRLGPSEASRVRAVVHVRPVPSTHALCGERWVAGHDAEWHTAPQGAGGVKGHSPVLLLEENPGDSSE